LIRNIEQTFEGVEIVLGHRLQMGIREGLHEEVHFTDPPMAGAESQFPAAIIEHAPSCIETR